VYLSKDDHTKRGNRKEITAGAEQGGGGGAQVALYLRGREEGSRFSGAEGYANEEEGRRVACKEKKKEDP